MKKERKDCPKMKAKCEALEACFLKMEELRKELPPPPKYIPLPENIKERWETEDADGNKIFKTIVSTDNAARKLLLDIGAKHVLTMHPTLKELETIDPLFAGEIKFYRSEGRRIKGLLKEQQQTHRNILQY